MKQLTAKYSDQRVLEELFRSFNHSAIDVIEEDSREYLGSLYPSRARLESLTSKEKVLLQETDYTSNGSNAKVSDQEYIYQTSKHKPVASLMSKTPLKSREMDRILDYRDIKVVEPGKVFKDKKNKERIDSVLLLRDSEQSVLAPQKKLSDIFGVAKAAGVFKVSPISCKRHMSPINYLTRPKNLSPVTTSSYNSSSFYVPQSRTPGKRVPVEKTTTQSMLHRIFPSIPVALKSSTLGASIRSTTQSKVIQVPDQTTEPRLSAKNESDLFVNSSIYPSP